jgi:Zn-dependent metalloprotease
MKIISSLVMVVTVFVMTVTSGFAKKAPQGTLRANDIIKPVEVYTTANAEIDAHTGIPRALWNINAGPYSGTPADIARQYLSEHSGMFQMQGNLSDLSKAESRTTHNVSHIRLLQSVNSVPVFRGEVVVSINHQNVVTFVANNYYPHLELHTVANIDATTALNIAKNSLHITGKIITEPKTELMVYAEEKKPVLAYKVNIFAEEPLGDWQVFVDANTGTIVSSEDIAVYDKSPSSTNKKVSGSGFSFDPDPLQSAQQYYNTPGYVDGNDADTPQLLAQRKLVTLQDITFSSGTYKLQGPHCKLLDFEAPTETFQTPANADSFQFTRSHQGFEEVMVYWMIDSSQRYMQTLGFDSIQNLPIECDPHGLNGADNSHFIPSANRLAWGEGGVDDDEDLDVIWHEYGHAIQYGIHSNWGGGEAGALGEGFGDYWAGSYSRAYNGFGTNFIFTWDAGLTSSGTGSIWPGRPLNDPRVLPPSGLSGFEIHEGGQLWAAVLMECLNDVGREVMDKLVLKSHYYLTGAPTGRQNAQAVIQADRDLYSSAHVQQLVNRFGARSWVNPSDYVPQIQHTKLGDTENLIGPYSVVAKVFPGLSSLNVSSFKIFYGRGASFTDSVSMMATGNLNEYAGNIPGNGSSATYRYYIIVKDSAGTAVTSPANAPTVYNSFYVGFDTVSPVIAHSPIRDQSIGRWPAKVTASVTDNLGVDSVWVDYYINNEPNDNGSFALENGSGNSYSGFFDIDTSEIEIGDSVFYKIVAKDNSFTGNISSSPEAGFHRFAVTEGIAVLVVYDSSQASGIVSKDSITNNLDRMGMSYEVKNRGAMTSGIVFSLIEYKKVIWLGQGTSTASAEQISSIKEYLNAGTPQSKSKLIIFAEDIGYQHGRTGSTNIDLDFCNNYLGFNYLADRPHGTAAWGLVGLEINSGVYDSTIGTWPDVFAPYQDANTTPLYGFRGIPTDSMNGIGNETDNFVTATIGDDIRSLRRAIDSPEGSSVTRFLEGALNFVDGIVGVNDNTTKQIPTSFVLKQNYPNPFNPTTKISFALPVQANVTLRIYNTIGQEVATLFNDIANAGNFEVQWNGQNSAGMSVASGMYFYRLDASPTHGGAHFTQVNKMVFLK